MLARDRHRRILELLEQAGSLTNSQLVEELDVSIMTVRRDLNELEHRGLMQRVHGGAQAVGESDVGYSLRSRRDLGAKRAIGRSAAELVQDGETIYLDAGTTTIEIARCLHRRTFLHLKVVTHAVNIASELAGHANITVIQLGGEIYRQTYAATGPLALETLRHFRFDRLFLAAQGFGLEGGLTNGNLTENEIKRAAMENARWTGLVADASKWKVTTLARIAPVARLNAVITDNRLPPEGRAALERIGLEVIVTG
jgi:DeoR/GlpR family transcriptional regulator of sugar metabolism